MKAHFKYFSYVMRHKWFVFLACRRLGVPLWRAIVHDWTKFLPSEWFPYVRGFYNPDGSNRKHEVAIKNRSEGWTTRWLREHDNINDAFDRAWLHHQKRNPHHWQYWVLINDEDGTSALRMPTEYVYEMVADWDGAGRAITGKSDPTSWYNRNGEKMIMHNETRATVVHILKRFYTGDVMGRPS